VPVEAGVAAQLVLAPGAEQHPVVTGSDEAGEEGAVALLVDLFRLVEALVGGNQRQ
jgi:hypothetical protein